jgi:WD40 repeat protein
MDAEEYLLFVNEKVFAETQKRLPELQVEIFRRSWNGERYSKIAEDMDRNDQHVKDEGAKLWSLLSEVFGEPVKKTTVQSVIRAHYALQKNRNSSSIAQVDSDTYLDLEDAPEIVDFHGREDEVSRLKQWILADGCRLVVLLGIGGIGKTSLSVSLVRQVETSFEYIIWISIRESPPIGNILINLIKVLSNQQETEPPVNINNQIRSVIQYLNKFRCLIILDNAESIMGRGIDHDQYLPGYEDYGTLIERIATSKHQSCLIMTSRIKPASIAKLEGKTKPVRCLFLDGLLPTDAQTILQNNDLEGSDDEAMQIATIYSGHPLALNLVANCIQEVFGGNMSDFLAEGTPIFNGIAEMINEQFDRLSDIEKSIIYWLAINREAVSIEELMGDVLPPLNQSVLQNELHSLIRCSLVQRVAKGFTLQNVIMEYAINRFIQEVNGELQTGHLSLFNNYALLKATAKDHVREAQIRFILQPIASHFANLETQLNTTIQAIRTDPDLASGYAAGNFINLLCCLNIDLSRYDFSGLTIRQAYLQGTIARNVDFAHAKLAKTVFTQDFGIVFAIAYSADGKYMATGHGDGVISLWDVSTGQEILNCAGHNGRVYSLAFSPTSDVLASGSDDQAVRLWNVTNGDCLKTLLGHSGAVGTVAFHPSGDSLASGSEDNSIRIWDLPTGACLKILTGHSNHIWSLAFSPSGTTLASGSLDNSAKIWEARTWACLTTLVGHSAGITSVAYSGTDAILATGSHDKSVRLWSVDSGACLNILQGHQDRVWSIAFSPAGDLLASGSYDKTVRLWKVSTGACINTLTGHTNWVRSVAFHPTKGVLASGSYDTTIRVWNVENGDCLQTFHGYQVSVCSIAIHPQGKTLASGSDDRTIRLWNLATGMLQNTLWGHGGWIYAVAFSPIADLLASGSADKTVKLWNIHSGDCFNTLQGHDGWIYAVAFNPAGDLLASGSADQTVRLWNTDGGACVSILQGHTGTVGSVVFSPSGKLLVSGSQDKSIKIWDIRSGVCLKTLQGHIDQIWSIAISPDGKTIASSSFDKTIRIWDIESGKCLRILPGHLNCLLSLAISPDGQMLVSGGYDKTVKLWDLQTGECLSTLVGHQNWVRSVLFTPDSQTIVSGSQDQTIRLWQTETGECLQTMRAPRPYEEMNITGILGLTGAEKETLKLLGAIENSTVT